MTPEFTALLTARLTELVADLAFDYKPDGSKRAPQIINPMLPARSSSHQEGEHLPFVRWSIYKGFFAKRPEPFSVYVSAGIYTAGDIDAGNEDILSLALALGAIVENKSYPPYRLQTPVEFQLGDPREGHEGLQPHPQYYMSMILDFLMP